MKLLKTISLCLFATVVVALITSCKPEQLPENETVAVEHNLKSVTDTNNSNPEIIITNIVKVFMHEPNHFSVVSMGKESKLVFHDFQNSGGTVSTVTIYADVAHGTKMWACYQKTTHECDYYEVQIHIHSPNEINGAGWSETRGKTTANGTTTSVE